MFARRLLSPALASSRRALRLKVSTSSAAGRVQRWGAAFSTIVHTSPHEDIDIPDMTIWEVMEKQAAGQPDKPAFVCGVTHEALTFSELHEGAKRMAVALARDGVRKGDVSPPEQQLLVWYCMLMDACVCPDDRRSCCTRSTASTTPWWFSVRGASREDGSF